MYRVPTKDIGAGNFVIGNTHITAAGCDREPVRSGGRSIAIRT